jgi:hypothetical protein
MFIFNNKHELTTHFKISNTWRGSCLIKQPLKHSLSAAGC